MKNPSSGHCLRLSEGQVHLDQCNAADPYQQWTFNWSSWQQSDDLWHPVPHLSDTYRWISCCGVWGIWQYCQLKMEDKVKTVTCAEEAWVGHNLFLIYLWWKLHEDIWKCLGITDGERSGVEAGCCRDVNQVSLQFEKNHSRLIRLISHLYERIRCLLFN